MNPLRLTASLVLYRPDLTIVERTLSDLQIAGRFAREKTPLELSITLVDNSDDAKVFGWITQWLTDVRVRMPDWKVDLIRAPANLGYGRGNNLVIDTIESDYHLVINPDLFVREDALLEAVRYLQENPSVGLLTPAVFGVDGGRQYLCKRNPTLFIMFLRSFAPVWLQRVFRPVMDAFEMRDCDYDNEIHPVEYPTGSCMFFRTTVLKRVGGFDPKFFLHYEDADIGRRLLAFTRTKYVPKVVVTHLWSRDTHKYLSMKWLTIRSGYYYWQKWGGVWRSRSVQEVPLSLRDEQQTAMSCLTEGKGRRVLVTGANGFIGSALSKQLAEEGFGVLAAARKLPVPRPGTTNCKYLQVGNLDVNTDWSAYLQGVDSIVHLVARVHIMDDSSSDPISEYRRENVDVTVNLARQAATIGVRRFVFLSSIKVNGESTKFGQPFTAEDTPRPEDAYGISKLEAEQALLKLSRETGMEVVIIRPPLVYGPGVKANFEAMMRLLCKPIPLPFSSVGNRRSFVSIGNLTNLIRVCIDHPKAVGEVFLVSDGADLSLVELIIMIRRSLKMPVLLFPFPSWMLRFFASLFSRSAYARRIVGNLHVDIEKNAGALGWVPDRDVQKHIQLTVSTFMAGRGGGA